MAGHRFNPDKASKLIDPKRRELFQPKQAISLLELQKSDTVADLGCGNGYLTIPIAKEITNDVFAVDIEPKMLDLLKERADQANLQNIKLIESDLENIKMNDNSVNKAVIAFVMHEIPDMKKALLECKRIIKEDGILLILEWEAVEMEMGPPLHERIASKDLEQILQENGFQTTVTHLNNAVYAAAIRIKKS